MRHDQIAARDSYCIAPFPPEAAAETASKKATEDAAPSCSAPAIPDVPVAVGRLIVAAYVAMAVVFAIGVGGDRDVNFALAIVGLFFVVYLTLPRILLGVAPTTSPPTLHQFLSEGMMTNTGWSGGKAALAQILIVPVCLVVAATIMMVVARVLG